MVFAAAGVASARSGVARRAPRLPTAAVAARWRRTGRCCRRTELRAITETNLGVALFESGRSREAQSQVSRRARHRRRLCAGLQQPRRGASGAGPLAEAIAVYQDGLRRRGDYPDLHYNLGNALIEAGRARRSGDGAPPRGSAEAAIRRRRITISAACWRRRAASPRDWSTCAAPWRWRPNDPRSRTTWARCCSRRTAREAVGALGEAVRLAPNDAAAHYDLGIAAGIRKPRPRHGRACAKPSASNPATPRRTTTWASPSPRKGRWPTPSANWKEALRLKPDFGRSERELQNVATSSAGVRVRSPKCAPSAESRSAVAKPCAKRA